MLPTRVKIDVMTKPGGSTVSWETVKNFTKVLDQEIDYAFRYNKTIVVIDISEAKKSWVS